MGVLINTVRQQAALVKADITGRCTNQPAHGMALHILRHVEPQQLNAQNLSQLFGNFCFADARWS